MAFDRRAAIVAIILTLMGAPVSAGEAAPAEDSWSSAFFALEGGAAFRGGDSDTEDGGAAWAGGGKLHSLKFDEAELIRAKLGYRWRNGIDAYLSFDRIAGGVSWAVDFPVYGEFGVPFVGEAISKVVLANVGFSSSLTPYTIVQAGIGLGLSINSIEETAEGNPPYAWPGTERTNNFAARANLGLTHHVTAEIALSISGSMDYYGEFATANYRLNYVPIIAEPIGPYEFDAWGGTISVGTRWHF